jgi:hypothetical protein
MILRQTLGSPESRNWLYAAVHRQSMYDLTYTDPRIAPLVVRVCVDEDGEGGEGEGGRGGAGGIPYR